MNDSIPADTATRLTEATSPSTRLSLLANGYPPLPNYDKRIYVDGWASGAITEEHILRWPGPPQSNCTGIRTGAVVGVDIDVADTGLAGLVRETVESVLGKTPLVRYGNRPKVMLLYRAAPGEEHQPKLRTPRYGPPGLTMVEVQAQGRQGELAQIEVLRKGQQLGAIGAHTVDETTGRVLRWYEWEGPTPLDVPLADLPEVTTAALETTLQATEALLSGHGLARLPLQVTRQGYQADYLRVADLGWDSVVDDDNGLTLADVVSGLRPGQSYRCRASAFREDAGNPTSLQVTLNRDGSVSVTDHGAGIVHKINPARQAFVEAQGARVTAPQAGQGSTGGPIGPGQGQTVASDPLAAAEAAIAGLQRHDMAGVAHVLGLLPAGLGRLHLEYFAGRIKDASGFPKAAILEEYHRIHQPPAVQYDDEAKDRDLVYIAKLNRLYHIPTGDLLQMEGQYNTRGLVGPETRNDWLQRLARADAIDYAPGERTPGFRRDNLEYLNMWQGLAVAPREGDAGPWLRHMEMLIPDARERDHILDWMAFTLQYPGEKINHAIIIAGLPGNGKDTALIPLVAAFGRGAVNVKAEELLRDFNSYLEAVKVVVVQEVEMGSLDEARRVVARLKPILTTPPNEIRINRKGVPEYYISNIVQMILTSNDEVPVALDDGDRRFFPVWCGVNVRDPDGEPLPEWSEYFAGLYRWYATGGIEAVVWWLLSRDVSEFNPAAPPPVTGMRREMVDASEPLDVKFVRDALEEIEPGVYSTHDLFEMFSLLPGVRQRWGLDKTPNARRIGMVLQKYGLAERPATAQGLIYDRTGRRRTGWVVRGGEDEPGAYPWE